MAIAQFRFRDYRAPADNAGLGSAIAPLRVVQFCQLLQTAGVVVMAIAQFRFPDFERLQIERFGLASVPALQQTLPSYSDWRRCRDGAQTQFRFPDSKGFAVRAVRPRHSAPANDAALPSYSDRWRCVGMAIAHVPAFVISSACR